MPRMTNTRRAITAAVVSSLGALTLAAIPGQAVADAPEDAVTSPQAYMEWLEDQDDPDATKTLDQYKSLSEEKQGKFLEYIKDPEHFKEFIKAVGNPVASRSELAGGDIVIERKSGDNGSSARGTAGDKSAWYSVSDTIFGVKVTTVKLGVNYRTTATKTTKVYGGWASHKNYVPVADFTHSAITNWISANPGNNAHSETVWTGRWAGGLGSWSARERVWADQDGFKGGYLKS